MALCCWRTGFRHNEPSLPECGSVPAGRYVVATGASPWSWMNTHDKSRRDDINAARQSMRTVQGMGSRGSKAARRSIATPAGIRHIWTAIVRLSTGCPNESSRLVRFPSLVYSDIRCNNCIVSVLCEDFSDVVSRQPGGRFGRVHL